MATLSDAGLVLSTFPYRDRHQILSVLTPSQGVIRGVLRNARGGKHPQAAATQLMSHVSCVVYRSPRAELATFREIRLLKSSFALTQSLSAAAAVAAVAEMMQTFFPENEPAEKPFRLGLAMLEALLDGARPELVVAYSAFWTLTLSGLMPSLQACSVCEATLESGFSIDEIHQQPCCSNCSSGRGRRINAESFGFLRDCRLHPVSQLSQPPESARKWLSGFLRAEAERSLKALSFFEKTDE